jgi:hypothetical protein
MTVLAPISDTTLGLGATKLRATFPYPFLHVRERFETPAVVVNFSSFGAGKFHRRAKNGCAIVHHRVGLSPANARQKYKKGCQKGGVRK